MPGLHLDTRDQALLDGKQGKAMQFAMEIIVAAARIDRAESLIEVSFAQIN